MSESGGISDAISSMSPPSSHSADLETEAQPGSAQGHLTMSQADLELEASPNHRSESSRPLPVTQSPCMNMPAPPVRVQELGESPGTILPGPLQPCQLLEAGWAGPTFPAQQMGRLSPWNECLGPSCSANQDEFCFWGSCQVAGMGVGCLRRVWH